MPIRVARVAEVNDAQRIVLAATFLGAVAGAPTAYTRRVFRAPYPCRLRAASATIGTTLAAAAVNFLSLRLSAGGTNVTAALTTAATALTADTPRAFTVTEAAADLDAGDVVICTLTPATADGSLDLQASEFLVDCEIVPR